MDRIRLREKRGKWCRAALLGLQVMLLSATLAAVLAALRPSPDWRADWAVAEGFTLRVDAEGFEFPTSIAVVPNPGPSPDDPLYFVTELRGTIKVVTNDHTVHLFATVPATTQDTLPSLSAEVGLAGICLEPVHGYVFATYAYRDADGVLRNGLARFQAAPRRFGIRPTATRLVRDLFAQDLAAVSHQIGPCQTSADAIFLSVGDGEQPARSQDLSSTLGKILRLAHDGRPAPGNPFQADSNPPRSRSIWALGLRNPFGLKLVGNRLFAADNGNAIDRFVEIERGRNYLWDGTDHSIGAAATQILSPSLGAVQLDFCTGAGFPRAWRNRFYLALSGRPADTGLDMVRRGKGVITFDYSMAERRMRSKPQFLLRYRGTTHPQAVVGVGCGPDRLYVVPLFPDAAGRSVVLTAQYTPDSEHPYLISSNLDPLGFMEEKNCFACHELAGRGGRVGPSLDYQRLAPRLRERLASLEYRDRVRAVDSLDAEPFASYRQERTRVLRASENTRSLLWIRYHLREPKFDNPESQMPNLGLSDPEAAALAEFLLTAPPEAPGRWARGVRLIKELPPDRRKQLALGLALSFAAGALSGAAATYYIRKWTRTTSARG
jgi:glucose/arabinose dehydrogenase